MEKLMNAIIFNLDGLKMIKNRVYKPEYKQFPSIFDEKIDSGIPTLLVVRHFVSDRYVVPKWHTHGHYNNNAANLLLKPNPSSHKLTKLINGV